jgi:8-oxo-dGTP pyrophosphatase MutT (NUDIX family)
MTTPDLAGAIPAATVVIARDGAGGLEVLVIERAAGMGFAGGAVAFPGGKVDAGDAPEGAPFAGFEGLDRADAIARVCAARECFEETGVLISSGPPVADDLRDELRPLSDGHEIAFGSLLARIGHRLEAAALKPFARWLPPSGLHKRFDTRFYLARLPEGEAHAADGTEAVHARWVRPADLLAEADAGQVSILFPTRCNIARLAQFATAEALLADPTPAPFIQPAIEGEWLRIPQGVGYPWTAERWETVRRA